MPAAALTRRAVLGVLSGILGAALPSPAQEDALIRTTTRLVVLHATVLDRGGNPVTDLPQSAFRITENGIEQPIRLFKREDTPVSLGLVIDNSGSMRDKREKVENSSLTLVKSSNPLDEVFVVNFNDDYYLDVPFTGDIKKMEEGLTRIDARGGTAMRDAMNSSLDYMNANHKRMKKVLLIITDGNDNTSSTTLERLINRARQAEILVYAIGLLNDEDRREAAKAKRALDSLAAATGGATHYPKTLSEVDAIAKVVAYEIRNQYTIGYSPTNEEMNGAFRQVKVTANGKKASVVRARNGYFATPDNKLPPGTPGAGKSD